MTPKSPIQTAGWLVLGSPLALLVALAIFALFAATSPAIVWRELHDPDTQSALFLSLKTTAVAAGFVVLFGLFLALAISRARPWLAGALELLVTIPAIMPPSVAGIALLLAFGRQGLAGSWLDAHGISIAFTPVAVVMAQAFVATPFFVREAATAFRSLDPELLDAARLDGAGAAVLARSVVFPLTFPFLATGAVLAWTRALGEFGATILFAGNLKGVTQTMPLAIYLGFESDLDQAKALAVILLVIALLVLVILRVVLRRRLAFAH